MSGIKLNDQQEKAVKHADGPLLIIAGAGTGKTTVIVERIKHIISQGLANSSEILALTFTEKASREMEERVDVAMPYGYEPMWIMTFHSFCDQVLRKDAMHIGLDTGFNLLTQGESMQFMIENLDNLELDYFSPVGNPKKYVKDLLEHFSRLADEDVSPEDYIAWTKKKWEMEDGKLSEEEKLEKDKYIELSNAYKIFSQLKSKDGVMDFSDLITNTLSLFRKRSNVLSEYKARFKYILVDEYQDTNYVQNELVKLLSGEDGNLTVVADDDQSIYKWRGASISNVVQFRKSFPDTKVITLTQNYRSSQTILDSAYKLIQNNNPNRLEVVEDIDKRLVSQKKGSGKDDVSFKHTNNIAEETHAVVEEIEKLVGPDFGYDYGDIAILVRANNHADPFVRAMNQAGIPNIFLGPGKYFELTEVVDLVSFLKFLTDPDDSHALYRLLSSSYLGINSYDLVRLSNKARKKNTKLYTLLSKDSLVSEKLPDDSTEKLMRIREILESAFTQINKKPATQLLYEFVVATDYIRQIVDPKTPQELESSQNVTKLFEKLRDYEYSRKESNLFKVVDWIDLSRDLGESPMAGGGELSGSDSVRLMTIHSAKGLEFPVVFLVNLVNQRFPSRDTKEGIPIPSELVKDLLPSGDVHQQEERRVFYVGLTRAKDRVYLTASDFYGEGKRQTKISSFVAESTGDMATPEKSVLSHKGLGFDYANTNDTVANLKPYKVDFLSFTRINTFRKCPLHYKLNFILNIPTPKTAALSFGSSVHAALEYYYAKQLAGVDLAGKDLIDVYKANWINEGYDSLAKEKRAYERGERYLLDYLEIHKNKTQSVYSVEQKFNSHLGQGSERIKINGKFDRVDLLPDGIEIIDYKTSEKPLTQKEVDKEEQMTFYALLVSKVNYPPFNVSSDKVKLSMYYLKDQAKVSTYRSQKQIKDYENQVLDIKKEIEESSFECSHDYVCRTCEYRLFCTT